MYAIILHNPDRHAPTSAHDRAVSHRTNSAGSCSSSAFSVLTASGGRRHPTFANSGSRPRAKSMGRIRPHGGRFRTISGRSRTISGRSSSTISGRCNTGRCKTGRFRTISGRSSSTSTGRCTTAAALSAEKETATHASCCTTGASRNHAGGGRAAKRRGTNHAAKRRGTNHGNPT